MLPFHHKCFEEFIDNNSKSSDPRSNGGLLVLGKGLGEWRVICQQLRLFCTNNNESLVIVLGSDFESWKDLCEWWGGIPSNLSPRNIDATTLSAKRKSLYDAGGCYFTTSRVLVTDLLNNLVGSNLKGILVLKAHNVTETSNETFAIRMIRRKYPTVFIRAFSEHPERLGSGFSRLSSVLKCLQIKKLFLYPRFRQEIKDVLDDNGPRLTEIAQPLSFFMKEIQSGAVEAIRITVDEIRRSASVDVSELTVENTLFRSFDLILKQKLQSVWNSVSIKTRQLIEDLQTLRQLLRDLLVLDCVSFYEKLLDIKRKSSESQQKSMWLLTDPGDRVFRFGKARIYQIEDNKLQLVLEPHLKMKALEEILLESSKDMTTCTISEEFLGGSHIVVLVKDEWTLIQVLSHISSIKMVDRLPLLERRFFNYLEKSGIGTNIPTTLELNLLSEEYKRLFAIREKFPVPKSMIQRGDKEFHPKNCFVKGEKVQFISRSSFFSCHLFSELSFGLLDKLRPKEVILYDPDIGAMREIECFHQLNQSLHVHCYLLFYETSVEEQRHLAMSNQEKDSFISLIKEKSELVFGPIESAAPIPSTSSTDSVVYDVSTGQMIKRKKSVQTSSNKVIVDVREFRSALAGMLDLANVQLVAKVLEVGDYILSPELCVERKAIPDLIQSFNSGRLFQQVTLMTRHYKKPCLLIEFAENAPFRFNFDVTDEISQTAIISKLVLLTLHFPDLKLIWSKSPRATVDLFKELQINQPEPDGDAAEQIERTAPSGIIQDHITNVQGFELLKKLPGITKENVYRVARGAGSLAELSKMNLTELVELCEGTVNAKLLHDFLCREL